MVEIAKNHGINNTFVLVCALILIPIMCFLAFKFVGVITEDDRKKAEKEAKRAEKNARKKRGSGSHKDS